MKGSLLGVITNWTRSGVTNTMFRQVRVSRDPVKASLPNEGSHLQGYLKLPQ